MNRLSRGRESRLYSKSSTCRRTPIPTQSFLNGLRIPLTRDHFYKNPTQKDFRLGPDVVNLMVHQHMCENTLATILNEDGSLFQDGVHDTHEEILLLTLFFEHEFNDMDIRCARVSYTSSDAEIKACFLHAVHKRFGLMDPAAKRLWLSNKSNKVYLIKTIHGIA